MAKPDKPLLSLGAHGTIADVITYQKRHTGTIARKKPTPAQPHSLPQIYQRWLYQDYIALWHTLTNAQKLVYRKEGSKHSLTAFAYFMQFYLKDLHDIIGIWHLDEESGAVAYDSSPNLNHGTVVGPSIINAIISRGRYWDGIDDRIVIPHASSLDFGTDDFSIELFCNIPDVTAARYLIEKNAWAASSWLLQIGINRQLYLYIRPPVGPGLVTDSVNNTVPLNTDVHIAVTVDRDGVARLFVAGTEVTYFRQPNLATMVDLDSAADLWIGYSVGPAQSKGMKDEIRLYRRILDPTTILMHSQRRYPPYSM